MPNFKTQIFQIFNLQPSLLASRSSRCIWVTVLLILGSGSSLEWWLLQQTNSTRDLATQFNRQALAFTDLYLDAYFATSLNGQTFQSQPKRSPSSARQQSASIQLPAPPIRQSIPFPSPPQLAADLSHGLQQASRSNRLFIVAKSGQLVASSSQPNLLTNQAATAVHADPLLQIAMRQLRRVSKASAPNNGAVQPLEFQLDGEWYFAQATSWTNPFGIDWLLVTIVPRKSFTANFHPLGHIPFLSLLLLVLAVGSCNFVRRADHASTLSLSPLPSGEGNPTQPSLQQVLEEKLAAKEALLKEVHHRVKNNLHIVANLLDLQADRIQEPQLFSLFTDAQTRIQAIALIHEQLYQSGHSDQIDLADYLRRLLNNIALATSNPINPIQSRLSAEPVLLNLETAVSCGLLINELVTNAFKHAFPNQPGELTITLFQAEDMIHIVVQDNGVGLPNGFDWRNSTSLGFKLVHILAKQLRATLTVDDNHGIRIELVFSLLKQKL